MLIPNNLDQMAELLASGSSEMAIEAIYGANQNSPVRDKRPMAQVYEDLAERVEKLIMENLKKGEKILNMRQLPFTGIYSMAEMIILLLNRSPEILSELMMPEYLDRFIPCHALNVAILSAGAGMAMELGQQDQANLAVAGLLHDVGMTTIDSDLIMQERDFSSEEREIVQSHPIEGYRLIEHLRDELPWLPRVVLEEHKRENERGYPAATKGDLHLYSKIVGICDVFEALSHYRFHRKAYHPADVMKKIIESHTIDFHPDIVKSLINSISLYPVGSYVILNNDSVARVIKPNPRNPLRPEVDIIENNGELTMRVKLSVENNFYISGVMYNEFYEPLNDPITKK